MGAFQDVTWTTGATGVLLPVLMPPEVSVGDVLLAGVVRAYQRAGPTGWTLRSPLDMGNGLSLYQKTADGTESGTTVNFSSPYVYSATTPTFLAGVVRFKFAIPYASIDERRYDETAFQAQWTGGGGSVVVDTTSVVDNEIANNYAHVGGFALGDGATSHVTSGTNTQDRGGVNVSGFFGPPFGVSPARFMFWDGVVHPGYYLAAPLRFYVTFNAGDLGSANNFRFFDGSNLEPTVAATSLPLTVPTPVTIEELPFRLHSTDLENKRA